MAATGKTPILLYGSTTATNQPSAGNLTNSSDGCEIAINVADKNLFFKDSTNTVNTVPIRQSSASSDGWLSSTDWSTFNSKQPAGTYVTSVTGTSPVASSGGTTPAISLASGYGDTQNPYASKTANYILAAPNGSAGVPTFRAMVAADVPTLNQNTTGSANSLKSNATTGLLQVTGPAAASTRVMTTPDANFTVARTDAGQTFSGLQNFSFTGANGPIVNRTNGAGYIDFQNTNVTKVQIGENGSGGLAVYTNIDVSAVLALNCRSDGIVRVPNNNLNVDVGNVVIGTSGKGIDFSATAGTGTSELLADYEEGTWTPTDQSGAGLSITVDHAYYTKIGRLVTVNGYITYPATTNTATASLSLPYTAAKYDIGTGSASSGNVYSAITIGGSARTSFRSASIASLTNANLSGAQILFTISYTV